MNYDLGTAYMRDRCDTLLEVLAADASDAGVAGSNGSDESTEGDASQRSPDTLI